MAGASTFAFKAMDVSGVASAGELEAESKAQVGEKLRQRGLIVLDVAEKREALKIEDLLTKWRGVDMRELAVFSRQFATLVASGMPMLRTLHTLEEQTQDEQIKEAIAGVRADVEAGSTLEQAMERYPKVFDRLFRAMVRSGEQSGRLEDALDQIAFQVEKADSLQAPGQIGDDVSGPGLRLRRGGPDRDRRLRHPRLRRASSKNSPPNTPKKRPGLPLPTQICVNASNILTGYWYILIPGIIALVYGFVRWKKTDSGHEMWDRFKLRLPAKIGDVIQKVALARWSRTFSGSVSSGVPMLQAIKLTGETSGNIVVEQAMDDVYASVQRGGSLAGPIEANPVFPPMVGHMVAVGEETGQLEHMLSKVADFYEAEVDAKVKALTALIEPIMIVFVGGAVGFIVISMYLPMFSIYEHIR